MSDYNRQHMQDSDLGADEAPIVVPPDLCAQASHSNRFSIVGVLVNPAKQSMKQLINQMPAIWGFPDDVIGRMIDGKKFQFVFPTEEALIGVLQGGPWSFADRMIVTKRLEATDTEEDLKMVQFWVQIKGIPPQYLSKPIINFIEDKFAQVLAIDFEDATNLTDHVWVLVNWNIDNPLRFKRKCQFAKGEISLLSFRYDRLMNFCILCGMLTHDENECPLYVENDPNKKTDEDTANEATGFVINGVKESFSTAFTGAGMCVGSSNGVSVPSSYYPPIDRDKLAETLRYLKAKLAKPKLPMEHKWSPTNPIVQPEDYYEDDHYSPLTEWPLCVKTEQVYHPMENGGSGVSGAKRKREDNDDDGSFVVLYPGSKEEACTYGDLSKLRRLPFSNYKANEVQNSGTFVSKLINEPKCNHEDTESVDSSA